MDQKFRPVTSCAVVPVDAPAQADRDQKLTANQRTFLTILQQAGLAGLTVEDWNEQAREIGLYPKQKQRLYDLRQALKSKRAVHSYVDRWYVTNATG